MLNTGIVQPTIALNEIDREIIGASHMIRPMSRSVSLTAKIFAGASALCLLFLAGAESSKPPIVCRHTHENLDAVLWMQTSAEYDKCVRQTYRMARSVLLHALEDPALSAATEQVGSASDLRPALIMDVDETVLDNSPFQAWMVKYTQQYDPALWNEWEIGRAHV